MKYRISFDVEANSAREAFKKLGLPNGGYASIDVNPFTLEEETIVLELARTTLKDEESCDYVAEEMDVSNEVLDNLREKIDRKMLTPA